MKKLGYENNEQIDLSWLGVRQKVAVPFKALDKEDKSIEPELLNQRFLQKEDYFQYPSWKTKMQGVFDNFNLLVIPSMKRESTYYYDTNSHFRRTPQGIFPNPLKKRTILQSKANLLAEHIQGRKSQPHDEYTLFEKEPLKLMVEKELLKSQTLEPIDVEVSMITNLQNIKQSLRMDYQDSDLVKQVLGLNFVDQLIEEHIREHKEGERMHQKVKYVDREASEFRNFIRSTYIRY